MTITLPSGRPAEDDPVDARLGSQIPAESPTICLTAASGDGKPTDVKVSVTGLNRTSALDAKSVTQTTSAASTVIAYPSEGAPAGMAHSRHSDVAGSYRASRPPAHSLAQSRPCESDQTRRNWTPARGGSTTVTAPLARSIFPR